MEYNSYSDTRQGIATMRMRRSRPLLRPTTLPNMRYRPEKLMSDVATDLHWNMKKIQAAGTKTPWVSKLCLQLPGRAEYSSCKEVFLILASRGKDRCGERVQGLSRDGCWFGDAGNNVISPLTGQSLSLSR